VLGGGFVLSECQDRSQRADKDNGGLAPFLSLMDFDSFDQAAYQLHRLVTGRFIGQQALEFRHLAAIEIRQVRMDINDAVVVQ
jgi:hypothetical protein